MNELNGPYVVIVLGIREGRGFDFLQSPLMIEASLKGHRIEADPVDPNPTPMVCTELVWETEKKEVRKLRSSHVPLRVECSCLSASGDREKFGFILLSLRSAAPVTGLAALTVEPKWHRLVSVPNEYRVHKPELALTLTVRDRICSPQNMLGQRVVEPKAVGECLASVPAESTAIVPIMYLDDGFIQIGHDSPKYEKFLLTFIIGTAVNMDTLLDKDLVFSSTSEKFYITLNILGLSINTKYFGKNLHVPIEINEKIAFKLLTNLELLKLFIDEFKVIPLLFQHGTKTLGKAEINLTKLLENENLLDGGEPCRQAQIVQFKSENKDFPKLAEERNPNISVDVSLELFKIENTAQKSPQKVEPSQNILNACGDQIQDSKIQEKTTKTEEIGIQTTPREYIFTKPSNVLKTIPEKQSKLEIEIPSLSGSYYLYNLTITFLSITWKKDLQIEGFQFKFQHPKANQALIINCDLEDLKPNEIMILEGVYCCMHFLATEDNIKNLIVLYPPTVSLQNYDDACLIDDFTIFTKLFQETQDYNCDYFAILNEVHEKDVPLCDLQIELRLSKLSSGLGTKYQESDFNLDPVILDDWLALKTVKDLEDWKEKQEILFKDNLKRLECEKLELLQAEWNVKRIELETKLQQGMQKCKVLSEELSTTANELKIKKQSLDEKLLSTPEARENIEIKVTQMLEDEMNRNVQRIEGEKQQLLQKIEQMQEEKLTLEKRISAKDLELEEIRKTTLTREQTALLLQELRHMEEKFHQAQIEKTFFKQQWRNALMEAHALKSEDQRQIQMDIRRKKEELSQLSLDRLNNGDDLNSEDQETEDCECLFDRYENYYYQ